MEGSQIRPIYNKRVRISNWQEPYEAFPLDNEKPVKLESHYKSLGATNIMYIPKTTAQEAMEEGYKKLYSTKPARRAAVNFTSYPLIDDIIDKFEHMNKKPKSKKQNLGMSTYKMDYASVYKKSELPCQNLDPPHFLFNRLPKNYFTEASPNSPYKFMDHHFYEHTSTGRDTINYMRQIRNASNIF